MTTEEYNEKMRAHEDAFDELWMVIVKDTNEFIGSNPNHAKIHIRRAEYFTDQMALSAAWILDRLAGKNKDSRGSMTKKIRKALGYSIP